MPHAVSAPNPGLQALILCGPGSSFPTFTANPDENPKALLPIANRPMVWYPLEYCYRMGVTEITLICPPSALETITTAMNTNPHLTSLPSPKASILAPRWLDQNTGTARILGLPEVRAVVKTDFFVLPCDIICEVPGEKLVHAWMDKGQSIASVLGAKRLIDGERPHPPAGLSVWYETKMDIPIKGEETDFAAFAPLPAPKTKPQTGSLQPHISNLVYSMPADSLSDLMEDRSGLPIRHGLVRSHPRLRMKSTLRDAHMYLFPYWIMEFIHRNERLESIGEDVIGWWAKAGWEKGLAEKLNIPEILDELEKRLAPPAIDSSSEPSTPLGETASQGGEDLNLAMLSQPSQPSCPPILAYVHPNAKSSGPVLRRVDTALLLLNVSLQLAKLPSAEEVGPQDASPFAHPKKVAYPEGVKQRTTITKADTLVAEHVIVEEKASIKESVVGANCKISEGAKLVRCVLMDGVVVGKWCRLTGCILGKRCIIGDNSILTDCEVQENLIIEERTEQKGEKLMSAQGLEATEEEMNEVLEEAEMKV